MSTLVVHPSGPLSGSVVLPGDKSISHRALILGALADGPTQVVGLSSCADVQRTRDCLAEMGVKVTDQEHAVEVTGRGKHGLGGSPVTLQCGDSGTTMRLLAGVLSGQTRQFRLEGSASLSKRPMNRVVEPLNRMGATLSAGDNGVPPIAGQGRHLVGVEITLQKASAQAGSAVLLAGLNAGGTTVVRYPSQVRDHTERMLAEMGAVISWTTTASTIDGRTTQCLYPPPSGTIIVPGDMSSAAYLIAAGTIVPESSIHIEQVGVNPGRTGLLDVLDSMGAPVVEEDWAVTSGEPVAPLLVNARTDGLAAVEVGGALIPRSIDELPLVAVLATQARGRTVVRDAAEMRLKESDRITAIVGGLRRMGASIEERDDGFVIEGPTQLSGADVDGHGDHRIVMALSVAALVADGDTTISDAERIVDSYPGFVEALTALGAQVQVLAGD